ncbi:uncharacterized protein LOC131592117 [Poecile atricapillus]|uniref:uncharacterized protein LOC131592117 n=1 Tax=Poecile atricapillus TaxID=48891 RepID=UPI002738C369|nr:uncharacterized protein LOC131592117 [Poecile atricapillus]
MGPAAAAAPPTPGGAVPAVPPAPADTVVPGSATPPTLGIAVPTAQLPYTPSVPPAPPWCPTGSAFPAPVVPPAPPPPPSSDTDLCGAARPDPKCPLPYTTPPCCPAALTPSTNAQSQFLSPALLPLSSPGPPCHPPMPASQTAEGESKDGHGTPALQLLTPASPLPPPSPATVQSPPCVFTSPRPPPKPPDTGTRPPPVSAPLLTPAQIPSVSATPATLPDNAKQRQPRPPRTDYLPNSPKPLLGRDLLENLGAVLKFNKDQLEFQVNEEQLITALSLTISCVEPKPESHNFEQILSKAYPLVWATDIPGKSKQAAPIVVELKAGTKPVKKKQYPLRIEDRKGIEPTIRRFMELGLLVECESDFNTPILPVKKPNGTYRLVQDLRAVNEITKALHPVVANPYTLLTRLKENLAWFTVLDLKDAFFCLPLALESQRIFAFEWESVDSGRKTQLTWTVLPQGWCNSPTVFGNQLAKELEQWERPLGDGTLLQYVDDLLIATATEEECIEWTISLLNFLGLSGYRVSQQKAQLVQKQVVYLGYEVSKGQRSLGAARKEAICQMPKPETVRDLRAFLGMTGWCRLWIYSYGILAKPLYDLLKGTKNILVWTPEAEEAFKKLKMELMRAPALGLPDVSKPFWLFSHERQGMALGVLAQQLGPHKRAVAYFSKRLDEVSKGWPSCLRAVAAVIINIEEARKLTLGQKVTVLVSHTVSAVLEQKGNHWLSPSRFLKYQAVLAESDDVTIQVTNIVNPASFLEGRAPAEPIEHNCLETIEAVYSSRPDLKEEPFEDADNWFSDGSSFVKQGVRMAGYAVTTTERVIESNPLPTGTSAQKAELIALTRALELAENMQINIWTDSKYAFSVVHAHGAIWKERGLLTTQGKTVKHAEEVLRLLEAVQLPAQVAIMHCKGHLTTKRCRGTGLREDFAAVAGVPRGCPAKCGTAGTAREPPRGGVFPRRGRRRRSLAAHSAAAARPRFAVPRCLRGHVPAAGSGARSADSRFGSRPASPAGPAGLTHHSRCQAVEKPPV